MNGNLQDKSILIVEDNPIVAMDFANQLAEAGARIVGPAENSDSAVHLIEATPALNAAVLDIGLGGELGYKAAWCLRQRHIPFVFATGGGRSSVAHAFSDYPVVEKPVIGNALLGALETIFETQ